VFSGWARRCRACEATPKAFDNPAQGCRACEATLGTRARSAQPCEEFHAVCVRLGRKFLLLVRCLDRKSTLGTRVNPPPNPAKGFTESLRVQSHTAAAIQSLRDWEAIITRVLEELLRLGRLPSC